MRRNWLMLGCAILSLTVATSAAAAANPFSDVPQDHWAYDAVQQLAHDGVLEGYGDQSFKGERAITRYEMAQMTAKAMAHKDAGRATATDKALIDKLASEYAVELKDLGVRVAVLERNADQVRIDGFFRLRQEHFGKQNKLTDTSKAYIESYIHANVTDHWTAETKHKITMDMKSDTGSDGTISMTNTYAKGTYKGWDIKLGKFDTVDGYAYTHEDPMRGVQLHFGNKLKTQLSLGSISNPNNNFDASYGAVVLNYRVAKPLNLYGAYHYFRSVDKGYKAIGTDNFGIANIGFDAFLGRNFRFIALYAHSSAQTTLDKNGYFMELDYKHMQVQNPGSFMIMLRNFRVTDATAISSRYEAYTHGNIRGTEIGFCYAPIRNVEVGAKYFWGTDVTTDTDKTFLRTEIKYFF